MKRFAIGLVLAASACSSPNKPVAPPPAPAGLVTPTPGTLSRIDPSVVEETDTYVIRRLPKDKYIKVDDRHIRSPIARPLIEFFKEDDQYYYVSSPKAIPGEAELKSLTPTPSGPTASQSLERPVSPGMTPADFEDLLPPRVPSKIRLEKVAANGLPQKGLWRASFEMADFNGDGILDIVCTTDRLGDGKLHIWIGDGKGRFTPWKVSYSQGGKPLERFSIDYGGVAVGDIDGDGKLDVVAASHGFGLVSLFGDGKGGFEVVRAGLAGKDFSSQAVVLLDADGDGKLDIVASRDSGESKEGEARRQDPDPVFRFLGRDKGWEWKKDGAGRGFLLQHASRLGLRPGRPQGRPDRQQLHRRADPALEERRETARSSRSVRRDRALRLPLLDRCPAPSVRTGAARSPTRYSTQANVPDADAGLRHLDLYVYRDGKWDPSPRLAKEGVQGLPVIGLAMGDLDGDGSTTSSSPTTSGKQAADPLPEARRQLRGGDGERRAGPGFAGPMASDWPTQRRRPSGPRALENGGLGRLRSPGGWDVYLEPASNGPEPFGVPGFYDPESIKIHFSLDTGITRGRSSKS